MAYVQWFRKQTPERQWASLDHMQVCVALGHVQRTAPHSDEAVMLTKAVRDHYLRYPDA